MFYILQKCLKKQQMFQHKERTHDQNYLENKIINFILHHLSKLNIASPIINVPVIHGLVHIEEDC